ncbi:MAG: 1-acyl-sn-glycerol-3-phosphate acyltransferase [Oscillospiraceae bacterium]|nr:1-acyl-sn-glycerol-3-phosphate acyltransferase [Oscillospiraceae bacterium]
MQNVLAIVFCVWYNCGKGLVVRLKENKAYLYRFIRFVCAPLFRFVYRPKIIGKENIPSVGSAVVAGNHKHALDPILIDISTRRIVRTLAKKELHDGVFGFVFRGVGSIPVDLRSSQNRAALAAAVDALNEGYIINVSPEAKRNYTDELLLPFKFGAVSMAKKTGAPIVPYAIAGDYKLFSKNLTVIFGEPFYVGDTELYDANRELYDRILELMIRATDKAVLERKHITSFDEWSKQNEQTPSS